MIKACEEKVTSGLEQQNICISFNNCNEIKWNPIFTSWKVNIFWQYWELELENKDSEQMHNIF